MSLNQPPSADYKNFSDQVKELASSEYNFTYNEQVVTVSTFSVNCTNIYIALFLCLQANYFTAVN